MQNGSIILDSKYHSEFFCHCCCYYYCYCFATITAIIDEIKKFWFGNLWYWVYPVTVWCSVQFSTITLVFLLYKSSVSVSDFHFVNLGSDIHSLRMLGRTVSLCIKFLDRCFPQESYVANMIIVTQLVKVFNKSQIRILSPATVWY